MAEVLEFPLLLPKLGRTRDALEAIFDDRRLKPTISMELDSSELLKRFVAVGVGVGFIARSNVVEDLQAKVLAAVTLADASIQRDLALVFRKDKALSRAALAFIDIAVKLKTERQVPSPSARGVRARPQHIFRQHCLSLCRDPSPPVVILSVSARLRAA